MNNLFKQFLMARKMDYLVINPELKIQDFSQGVMRFTEGSESLNQGEDVQYYFPELIGTEDIIDAIIQGHQDYFELNAMSRQIEETTLIYFNIYFLGVSIQGGQIPKLMLLFEDVTQRMELEQALVSRN
ncbi:MAG: hypothetical protein RSE13_03710 [Planktothrix sp. GU0601_MAG3]|nr:MAG: hypothetical protein RSE13_03710 [Planktothrix sp. GU0601_MAG3]